MVLVALLFVALSMAPEAWAQALIEPQEAWHMSRAAMLLQAEGYSSVRDIKEGYIGNGRTTGWLTHKLPRQPCTDC